MRLKSKQDATSEYNIIAISPFKALGESPTKQIFPEPFLY